MNNTQAFITLGFFISYFFYTYIIGAALLESLKIEYDKTLAISTGLIVVFTLVEITSLPFMLNSGNAETLFSLFSIIGLFIFAVSLIYLFYYKKKYSLLKFKLNKLPSVIFLIFIGIVILQTIIPTAFARFDGDDAFYIAVSTSIETTKKIFMNNPSIGLDKFPFPPNYKFASYEILITYISRIISFDPVVVYHTLLPLIFIPTYYVANYALAKALFPYSKKKQEVFVLVVALLSLFDGYSNYTPSSFILLKAWMGKSITINICFPVLLAYFIKAFKSEEKKKNYDSYRHNFKYFFMLALVLIAGVCTSAVGLYLLPVFYFLLFLAALFTLKVEDKKDLIKQRINFIVKSGVSAIPSAALLVGYLVMMLQSNGIYQLNNFDSQRNWLQEANLILNSNIPIIALFIIAFVYFIFFGKRTKRTLFVFAPVLLLLTFLNPALHEVVGRYLTSLPVYWRLFWLIPVFFIIAAFLAEVTEELKGSKFKYLLLIPLLIICNINSFSLNETKYFKVENSAKIPDDIAMVTSVILDNVTTDDPNDLYCLALPSYNIYLRQYTGEIALVMPRANYVEEAYEFIGNKEGYKKIKELFVYDDDGIIQRLANKFNTESLKELGITIIITPNKREELQKDFREITLSNDDYLYLRKDIAKEAPKS